MKVFVVEGAEMPEVCPEGHAREMADDFADTAQEVPAAK
jgi:hypothetical protein